MAVISVIVTLLVILALFMVIPALVWLIYKGIFDRHANAMLSEGKTGKKWLPPFVVALITFAAEIVLIIGFVSVLRVDYGSKTESGGRSAIEVENGNPGERIIRLYFTDYNDSYCIGGTWDVLYAEEDDLIIQYVGENGDLYEMTYRVSMADGDALYMGSDNDGIVTVDVSDIDPESIVSIRILGIDATGEYINEGVEVGFGGAS